MILFVLIILLPLKCVALVALRCALCPLHIVPQNMTTAVDMISSQTEQDHRICGQMMSYVSCHPVWLLAELPPAAACSPCRLTATCLC